MSGAIAFDTHRFVKKLTERGFTEEQAEVLAEEQVTLLNANLATKSDIEAIRAEIETLRLATKADIEAIRAEIETLRLATKADIEAIRVEIEALRKETKADIARSEAGLKADIEAAKADLLKWLVGGLITQGGLIVALLQLLK